MLGIDPGSGATPIPGGDTDAQRAQSQRAIERNEKFVRSVTKNSVSVVKLCNDMDGLMIEFKGVYLGRNVVGLEVLYPGTPVLAAEYIRLASEKEDSTARASLTTLCPRNPSDAI